MAAIYRVTLTFSANGYGTASNVFHVQNTSSTQPSDALILGDMSNYMSGIFNQLRPYMSNTTTLLSGLVQLVNGAGQVIRNIGGITPTVGGTATSEASANTVAMSVTARTNEPKVRGGKRFPGLVESSLVGQVFTNGMVAILTNVLALWIGGYLGGGIRPYLAGVVSSKVVAFVPFNGTGILKNYPGTQVTRKPFRGA